MKINTSQYGIFYKNRNKWTGPYLGKLTNDLLTVVANHSKITSKIKKPWKLMKQVFVD